MDAKRRERGLLAGLVTLLAFASGAVAMTAHGASSGTAAVATPTQISVPVRGDDDRGRTLVGRHR